MRKRTCKPAVTPRRSLITVTLRDADAPPASGITFRDVTGQVKFMLMSLWAVLCDIDDGRCTVTIDTRVWCRHQLDAIAATGYPVPDSWEAAEDLSPGSPELATVIRSVNAARQKEERKAYTPAAGEKPAAVQGAPELDTQKRQRVKVKGKWYNLTDEGWCILSILFEAKGDWVPGRTLKESRPDKPIGKMPPAVRKIIESNTHDGYCIPSLRPK